MSESTGYISPESISEEAIPIITTTQKNANTSTAKSSGTRIVDDAVNPETISPGEISQAPIAKEVVSSSFDSIIRRIMGAYSFGQVGSIVDLMGNSIADFLGINSLTQFINKTASRLSSQTTTSTSYVDISDTTITLSLKRAANLLINMDVTGYENSTSGAGGNLIAALNVDGAVQTRTLKVPGRLSPDGSTVYAGTGMLQHIVKLAAGNHTLKMQFKSSTGTTVTIEQATLSYVALGK